MAQIGCPRRERRPLLRNIKHEVRNRNRIMRIIAPLGIVGLPGTGRKTLAYRLDKENEGAFQHEVPVEYFYMPCWAGRFSAELPSPGYSEYSVLLIAYIIEEPVELPRHNPALYWQSWKDFCCLIFVFDVTKASTYLGVSLALNSFRRRHLRLPLYFIVGNKCDQRSEVKKPDEISREAAEMQAEFEAADYFECSALQNIGITSLLSEVKLCAVNPRYVMA